MPEFIVNIQGRKLKITAPNKEALPEIVETIARQQPPSPLVSAKDPFVIGKPGIAREERGLPTSPLSISERAFFALADDRGKREILREKFPRSRISKKEGNFFIDNRPIDPRASSNPFEENLADLVELHPEILRVGGGLLGFVGGAGLASIPLAGLGAAGGEAINQIIGRAIGARREIGIKGVEEAGRDIAITGITEAAAQGAGIGLTKLFRGMSKHITEPVFRRSLAVLSDVPEQAIKEVQKQGAEKIFTTENLKPRKILSLGRKLKDALTKNNKRLGKIKGSILEGIKKERVRVDDIADDLFNTLKANDIIDSRGRPIPNRFFDKQGKIIEIKKISPKSARGKLLDFNNRFKRADRGTISNIQKTIDDIDELIKSGKEGALFIGKNDNAILVNLRRQLATKINRSSGQLATANREFSEFRSTLDNASDIFGDFKDKTIENNFKNIFKESAPHVKLEALENVEKLLPTEDIFLDELKQALTANVFLPTTAPRTAAGISIRSLTGIAPRTAGRVLRGQRAISRFGGRPLSIIGKGALRPQVGPRLREFIAQRAAQRSLQPEQEIQARPIIRQPGR